MKAVVSTFNQEKALVGAFSMIAQPVVEPIECFAALIDIVSVCTHYVHYHASLPTVELSPSDMLQTQ